MDIKRTVLWVIFCSSLFLLYDKWNVGQGNSSFFAPPKPVAANAGKSDLPPSASGKAVAGTPATPGAPVVPGTTDVVLKGETIRITTDVFKADIDTLGGELKRLELLNFKDGVDTKKNQVLFDAAPHHT